MTPYQLFIILIVDMPAIWCATAIGGRRGRPWTGFTLALLLSWIGVAVIAATSPTHAALVRRERQRMQAQQEAAGSTQVR